MLIKELREKIQNVPDDREVALVVAIPEEPYAGDELVGFLDEVDTHSPVLFLRASEAR